MDKKLPRIFANKINKSLDNNDRVFYSNQSSVDDILITNPKKERVEVNINQKINSIFTSPRYVYKADVSITTKDGIVSKRIIGRNSTHLITIDNELVSISDIIDIDFSE